MKIILIFVFIIGVFSCQTESIKTLKEKTYSIDQTSTSKIAKDDINGIWALSSYFDSIKKHKKIAKYRIQEAAWFGIILEIKNDSLFMYGSIHDEKEKIELNSDTIVLFGGKGDYNWVLQKVNKDLTLSKYSKENNSKITTYLYKKRNDLNFLTKDLDKVHFIKTNITNYFNREIFSGTYQFKNNPKKVIFKENGELIGINGYEKYKVRNYFGTYHPHKNLDVITFINENNKKHKQYNWIFDGNSLILTEFVSEMIEYKGKMLPGDKLILGKEKIELIKMNKH